MTGFFAISFIVFGNHGAGYGSRTRLLGLGSRCTTDVRILHMKFICRAVRGRIREYSADCVGSVPLRIFFWLRQKLRCCASRPSCDGKILAVAPASSAWEADVLPMYESCVDRLSIIASFRQKSNRFLANKTGPSEKGPVTGVSRALRRRGWCRRA